MAVNYSTRQPCIHDDAVTRKKLRMPSSAQPSVFLYTFVDKMLGLEPSSVDAQLFNLTEQLPVTDKNSYLWNGQEEDRQQVSEESEYSYHSEQNTFHNPET